MQVESLAEFLQNQEERLDLRIGREGLKDICDISPVLIIPVEDSHIDDQTPQTFTEAHFDAVNLPPDEEQFRYAQFMLPPME